jgi:hypothetical protein
MLADKESQSAEGIVLGLDGMTLDGSTDARLLLTNNCKC